MKMKKEKRKDSKVLDQKGQTFIEFIFLFLVLISLSFGFLSGFRSYIGFRWEKMIKIIASPNENEVQIP